MIAPTHPRLSIAAILAVASIRFVAAVMAASFCHVDFAANDGLDVALAGFIEEICGGKEIAVVGDGHRRDFLAGSFIPKLGSFASPIEQTVIRMTVQMHELRLAHGTPS